MLYPALFFSFESYFQRMQIRISDLSQINHAALEFIEVMDNHKVFAFEGEMGVGKTTFISSLLKSIGITELEGSPTYSIVNEYRSDKYGKIYHFDMYRLKNEMEAYDMGFNEIFDSGAVCFIEWPSKVENVLPDDTIWVNISKLEDNSRTITLEV